MPPSDLPIRAVPWSRFVRRVTEETKDGPVLVTRHGKPCCIAYGFPQAISVMSDSERMALLVAQAEISMANGKGIPHDQVFADLRRRLRQRKRSSRKAHRGA